jgi:hypothetical protein
MPHATSQLSGQAAHTALHSTAPGRCTALHCIALQNFGAYFNGGLAKKMLGRFADSIAA